MRKLTADEIRKTFESSNEFDEIFDAFQQALHQRLDDIELYRKLFWNHMLTPAERCLFGEKLAKEFSPLAYDVYMWLANVFEVTYSMYDNYELALEYYRKAALTKPDEHAPYTAAANCYEPDLRIPPITHLIDFLKEGIGVVREPRTLYERLAYLYDLSGNDEMSMYFRRKTDEGSSPGRTPASP
ncbi:MAG TPA: hypothetical protein VLY03_06410 [Bacteroidota bacterium]|nr:hypothetical protein [Bacteroidota bacterium]